MAREPEETTSISLYNQEILLLKRKIRSALKDGR